MEERILAVDDEIPINELLARYLEKEGYVCETAFSAEEALDKVKERKFALALIDIKMPGMNGIALLEKLKEMDSDMAVLVVTAVKDREIAIKAMKLGADDYIVKPFDLEEIVQSVKRALERRRLALQVKEYHQRLEKEVKERTEELKRRAEEMAVLYQLGRNLSHALSLDILLDEVVKSLYKALGYPNCAVFLMDEEKGELYLKAAKGYGEEIQQKRIKIGQEGVTGWVAAHKEPLIIPDVTKDSRYLEGVKGGRAELAVPMIVGEKLVGVLDVESTESKAFDEHDLELLSSVAAQAAVAIRNAQLFEELKERERRLTYQLENASDAIVNVDLAGRFTFFNRAAEAISGYKREEVLGRPFTDLLCPEYHQKMLTILRHGIQGEIGQTYEVEFFDKWGERVPLEISIATLKREGRAIGGQVIARDIRARKRLENELLEFIAKISHDLKTPLTSIVSFSEILLSYEHENPETCREFLTIINEESKKLTKVLEETLNMSRLGFKGEDHGQKDSDS